jgi:SulP family sulfate permease
MRARRRAGGDLYFHRPRTPVLDLWRRIGFIDELGADHVFASKRIAIATIFDRLDRGICAHCTVRVFDECGTLPPPVAPFITGDRSAGAGRVADAAS